MKKLAIILVVFLSIFFVIQNSIGNSFSIFQNIKYAIPKDIKLWLKENIFVHKSYQLLKVEKTKLQETIKNLELESNLEREKVFYLSNSEIFFKQSILNAEKKILSNYEEIRNDIIENFILPNELITIQNKEKKIPDGYWLNKPDGDFTVYKVNYYNMHHYGILEKKRGNKKLLIYNQGHDNNPYNHKYFINIKNFYKNKGYDILSLSMSNLGYNLNTTNKQEVINFPGLEKPIIHLSHYDYEKYYDPNYPNIQGLALMLSGNYYLIKNQIGNYDDIVMVGISGGGWYTLLLSSIITEINKSFSFAGTFPFLIKMFGSFGDWEQIDSKIYKKYNYLDFYFLNIIDGSGNFSRHHSEIYNTKDTVFNDPAASLFKKLKDETLSNENFTIYLVDSDKHEIDFEFLKDILK